MHYFREIRRVLSAIEVLSCFEQFKNKIVVISDLIAAVNLQCEKYAILRYCFAIQIILDAFNFLIRI